MNSIFTISLDFELHWGGFEKWPLATSPLLTSAGVYTQVLSYDYRPYFWNTRIVIPEMLKLFSEYDIHVTWATVGMLMNSNKDELLACAPSNRPTYQKAELSAYHYIENIGIGNSELEDPNHYAASIIERILETPHQELGTHTFSHYYCNELGQSPEQFRADLLAAKSAALKFGRSLQSLVFPRNQFNETYLKISFEEGIRIVRSNPADWFWQIESTLNESLWKRFNRGLDAYFPLSQRNRYSLESLSRNQGQPICFPASRLLRPYRPDQTLNEMRIRRIINEMERAASHNEVYHLWWHPHNFASYPQDSLRDLRRILEGYAKCRRRGMQTKNMGEIANLLGYGT
jgi:peptidoglycan/xylan/chitin deacetylase (PgdA/CDA1 family)